MRESERLLQAARANIVRNAARDAIQILCDQARDDLVEHLLNQTHRLTDSEVLELSHDGAELFRLARTLLIATGTERIEGQFNCEAIKGEVRRTRRWLKSRC